MGAPTRGPWLDGVNSVGNGILVLEFRCNGGWNGIGI